VLADLVTDDATYTICGGGAVLAWWIGLRREPPVRR
jgi:hypothetical protein